MGAKRKFSEQVEADPGAASSPASAPATAPPSSRSDSATPFSPSSSFSKCITLHDWWLIKSDTDSGGKRLAIGGLNAIGKFARAFTSAPIVKRHDAYTLETADGITVQFQGFINTNRTHDNGIPFEVSQFFLIGFPFNWEQYAGGDFGEKSTSPIISMRCSAPAPAPAPPSSRSDYATPFSPSPFPSPSFSKCITLHDWWLIKSDTDSGGKRLAVEGLNVHGKCARNFTSAPIVKRHDAYTLETADGTTVQFDGFINEIRMHDSGFPPEVSQCFLVGFPFNWEQYADGDFGEKSTSPTISMRCSGIDKLREHSSDLVRLGKLLDGLTSGIDALMNDESRKNFAFARRSPNFSSSVNTALHNLSSSNSFRSSVASQPVETSRSHEMDKSNQDRENGVECANLTGHDNVGDGLHDGVSGESSAIANDTVAHLPTDMKEKLNDESERISVDVIAEGVSNDLSPEEHQQQTSRPENCAVNCRNLSQIERPQDVGVSQSLSLRKDSVGKDSDSLTGKVTLPLVASSENCALKWQNHAEKASLQDVCDSQDVPSRKDSVEMDSDAVAGKVSSPLVALFESPLPSAQRNNDNESTPNSLLKTGSIGLSPNVSGRLHQKYERGLGDYLLRSQNRAERIRVHRIGDSEVSAARKDTHRNETDSLSINTDMALQTVLRSSPNDEDRKLVDSHTTDSAKPAVERASNSSMPTERDDSNNKLGRGRYALRSRDHVRKIGVDNAGGSEVSVGRKDSKESYANSMIEKNLPFEPLIKAPNKKGGYNLRSQAKNEWRFVTVRENRTTLGVFKQCEQIHVQSLVTDGPQEANLLSAKEANSKHHSKMPASPDVMNKKGADHSERNNSLRRSSRNESFKTLVQYSVKHAIHSVHAVRDDSDKASDITGKRIEELPHDQDGNQSEALTEAQVTKQKTHKESRQKTVRTPNHSKETPLAQDKREKLSVTSPDLLNLKRSRSGRLLIPPIARWRGQVIIYDMDGSVTGIRDMDGLSTPSKGNDEDKSKGPA